MDIFYICFGKAARRAAEFCRVIVHAQTQLSNKSSINGDYAD
jgi:hypothetical protein